MELVLVISKHGLTIVSKCYFMSLIHSAMIEIIYPDRNSKSEES
jgi:hypothetical protein